MKTGRGPGQSPSGVKFVAANKAAVLQAAAGTVVLLLLALAWVALGDASPSTPAAEPPQGQTRPLAVPEAAPKAISQSASGTVSSDSPATPPVAPAPSTEAAASASAALAASATTAAQPVSSPVAASPAAVAQASAAQAAIVAPTPATTQPGEQGAGDKAIALQSSVCEPAPQDASCTGAKRFPPAPPGNGFMVEVGTFTDAEKAEILRRELARHGQAAYLQSRVLLGPFPDRKSAQQAEEKIRRERKLGGMILPPHKP